jgi:hypothetical protein
MVIKFTGGTERGGAADAADAGPFRGFPDLTRFPLGGDRELVYSPLTRAAHALPAFAVALVQNCRTLASLQEHAARIGREHNLGPDQCRAVHEQLRDLAQAGLLTSRADLVGCCRSGADSPAPVAVLGVPTRNRTRSLTRCLGSYLENGRRHGRTTEYVVIDGSEGPDAQRANRELLRALAGQYGAAIAYTGPEEMGRFAGELVRRGGLPGAAVEFGLLNPEGCPVTTGGSRNALLLHAVGDCLLQVDDDTVCRLTPAPGAREGLVFSSFYDPTEFWFPPEGEPYPSDAAAAGVDFLALHEGMLGKSPGDCAARLPADAGLDLDQTTAAFFRKLDRQEGKILATSAGVVGHSGMGSSLYFLTLGGPSRARLLGSERVYRRVVTDHQVMRAVTRPTVCDGAFCMGLNLGLDNRRLLPPFLPVQRNQDGVFAALLRGCRADGFCGFLPWAVCHEPPAPRVPSGADPWQSAAGLCTGQIVQVLVQSVPAPPAGTDAASCLKALGCTLEEWGSLPPADFEELLRLRLWGQLSRQAVRLAELLQQFRGLPEFWGRDARRVLAHLQETLPSRRFLVPSDLSEAVGDDGAVELFRRLVRRFGQLLRCWPDLVEVARELRSRGIRLAEKLE